MSTPQKKKKPISQDELAVVYAALILVDDDIPVTEDKINSILQAAEVKVEPIWPALFAKAVGSVNIKQMISNVAAGAGGGDMPAGTSGAGPAPPAGEEKKEEKKAPEPESEEDSDDDMGLSLFD